MVSFFGWGRGLLIISFPLFLLRTSLLCRPSRTNPFPLLLSERDETNVGINYDRLGVNRERVVTARAPPITESKHREVHLDSTHFQIEAVALYQKQKPWWKKRDPLFQLLDEEAEAARTAEEVARAIEACEGGVGSSRAAEEEAAARAAEEDEALLKTSVCSLDLAFQLCLLLPSLLLLIPFVPPCLLQSEESNRQREGKAPARPEDQVQEESEDSDMDEQPLRKWRRRMAIIGPHDFQMGPRPGGINIREPEEGGELPRVPPPPPQSPPKTPPPLPEMEVDQKTPDPKGGVPAEGTMDGVEGHNAESAEKPAAEGFSAEIARVFVAFVLKP